MTHTTILLLVGSLWVTVVSAPIVEQPPTIKELNDRLRDAATPDEKAADYRQLFEKVGRTELLRLTKDDNTELALQAAWEIHKMKTPKHVYNSDELARFVKFVKERTKAPLPGWWEEAIVDVEYSSSGHFFRKYANRLLPEITTIKEVGNVIAGATMERRDNNILYIRDKKIISFPLTTFDAFPDSFFVGDIGEKQSFVASCYFPGAFPFQLAGFELAGGKPVWIKNVWATGRKDYFGPPGKNHRVELRENGGTLFVLGAEPSGMYLEAYESSSGKCLYRFCTCYWFNYSEKWNLK